MNIEMIIIISFITAMLVALGVSLFSTKNNAGLKKRIEQIESKFNTLQNDMRALCTGAVGLGEKMIYLEQQSRKNAERNEMLEMRDTGDRPYQQAIRMVQNGSSVEELISICQISQGEAELVEMMHRMDKAS